MFELEKGLEMPPARGVRTLRVMGLIQVISQVPLAAHRARFGTQGSHSGWRLILLSMILKFTSPQVRALE